MWLRKLNLTGAAGIGPHQWTPGADIAEVPDELGRELLYLDPLGYEQVGPPKAPEPAKPEPVKAAEPPTRPEPLKGKPAAMHGRPDLGDS